MYIINQDNKAEDKEFSLSLLEYTVYLILHSLCNTELNMCVADAHI